MPKKQRAKRANATRASGAASNGGGGTSATPDQNPTDDEVRAWHRANRLHWIHCYLAGISERFSFPISADDSERGWNVFANDRDASDGGFFQFATLDGFEVAVSIADTQLAELSYDYHATAPQSERPDDWNVGLYFRGRPEPYRTLVDDSEQLAWLFDFLEFAPEQTTAVNFTGAFAQDVVANTRHLVLAIGVLEDVEEGRAEIAEDERSRALAND